METIRNHYGITIQHATKAEIGVLKYLGVVGIKAGRSLLYRAADVSKMFAHWRTVVPDFINELSKGKVCVLIWAGGDMHLYMYSVCVGTQSGGRLRLALRHGLSTCISSRVHVQIHVVHD